MKRGKFIVFEGISGTGKDTQAKLLHAYLEKKGVTAHIVHHPSAELKDILHAWRKERNISSQTEAYLFIADRLSRIDGVINPTLSRGEWVISLRNWVSARVYQGYTGEVLRRTEPVPYRLFYFDISPEVALSRVEKRGETRGKFETLKRMDEKRKIYRQVLKAIPHVMIDAGGSIDEVHRQVVKYI